MQAQSALMCRSWINRQWYNCSTAEKGHGTAMVIMRLANDKKVQEARSLILDCSTPFITACGSSMNRQSIGIISKQ